MIFYVYYQGRKTNLTIEARNETDAANRARAHIKANFPTATALNDVRVSRHAPKYDHRFAGEPFPKPGYLIVD